MASAHGPGTQHVASRPRRPDESMTLLTELMDRPLDPAYAAAAAARGDGPVRPRPWNTVLVGVAAVLTGLLFATSGLSYAEFGAGRGDERADLVARIEDRRRAVEQQGQRIAALREDLRALEAGALEDRGVDTRALAEVGAAAGDVAVQGPGLRITLDDTEGLGPAGDDDVRAGGHDDTGRIVYRDVQNVANELWAAGAEAVSINGHRLTSVSAIRFAGPAILVGFRPLARPYTIEAVMGPAARRAFLTGPGGSYLDELRTAYGVRAEARPRAQLTIPAADSLTLRYARVPAPSQATPTGDGADPTGGPDDETKDDG